MSKAERMGNPFESELEHLRPIGAAPAEHPSDLLFFRRCGELEARLESDIVPPNGRVQLPAASLKPDWCR